MEEPAPTAPPFRTPNRPRRKGFSTRNGILLLFGPLLAGSLAWPSDPEQEPSGLIARIGTRPTIDGVFEAGEWDDAAAVQTGEKQYVRVKCDGANLYLAIDAGGGNLWFDFDGGLRVLHWSAQLGSAEYVRSDASTQVLERPFAYELFGLQHESPEVVQEALADYLAEHGWVSNISAMGPKMESEFAVSLEWLGVTERSSRYLEVPGIHIAAGLMLVRGDPETETIMAMPPDQRRRRYPALFWPNASEPSHPLNQGSCPDTIRVETEDFGRIWIDLSPPSGNE